MHLGRCSFESVMFPCKCIQIHAWGGTFESFLSFMHMRAYAAYACKCMQMHTHETLFCLDKEKRDRQNTYKFSFRDGLTNRFHSKSIKMNTGSGRSRPGRVSPPTGFFFCLGPESVRIPASDLVIVLISMDSGCSKIITFPWDQHKNRKWEFCSF